MRLSMQCDLGGARARSEEGALGLTPYSQRPKLNAPGVKGLIGIRPVALPDTMIWLPGKLLACVLSAWARLALL